MQLLPAKPGANRMKPDSNHVITSNKKNVENPSKVSATENILIHCRYLKLQETTAQYHNSFQFSTDKWSYKDQRRWKWKVKPDKIRKTKGKPWEDGVQPWARERSALLRSLLAHIPYSRRRRWIGWSPVPFSPSCPFRPPIYFWSRDSALALVSDQCGFGLLEGLKRSSSMGYHTRPIEPMLLSPTQCGLLTSILNFLILTSSFFFSFFLEEHQLQI